MNSINEHDVIFNIESDTEKITVYANKALLLYRSVEKERNVENLKLTQQNVNLISDIVKEQSCPAFLKRIYQLNKGEVITFGSHFTKQLGHDIHRCKHALIRLCNIMYIDTIVEQLNLLECQDIAVVADYLGLKITSMHIMSQLQPLKSKLNQRILRDLQLKKYRVVTDGISSNLEQ